MISLAIPGIVLGLAYVLFFNQTAIYGTIVIKDVFLPQTSGTILESFSYFFVNAMVTISAVSFLSTSEIQPLSLMIPGLESMMLIESISFVSIVILAVNIALKVLIYFVKRWIHEHNTKGELYSMELNRKEFGLLTFLGACEETTYTQRELSQECEMSLGTVNQTLQSLQEKAYIDGES